ncbi:hypothetical protein [Lacihabitans soyangensis]|nr:hypothetical protein [Lacihabitans soyangensis]
MASVAGLNNEEMSFKDVPFGKRMSFLAKHNVVLMGQVDKLEAALRQAQGALRQAQGALRQAQGALRQAQCDSVAVDVAWGKKYNAMVEQLTTSNNRKYRLLKEFVIESKKWTVFLKWLEGQPKPAP